MPDPIQSDSTAAGQAKCCFKVRGAGGGLCGGSGLLGAHAGLLMLGSLGGIALIVCVCGCG